jgi:hypothetical protein
MPQLWAIAGAWFVGGLLAFTLLAKGVELAWGWLRPPRLTIVPHGGENATLTVSPSIDTEVYGQGLWKEPHFLRRRSFRLCFYWTAARATVRAGDSVAVLLAKVNQDPYNPELQFYGDDEPIERIPLETFQRRSDDTPWFHVRVELRVKAHKKRWIHHYRVRLQKYGGFVIEEESESNS